MSRLHRVVCFFIASMISSTLVLDGMTRAAGSADEANSLAPSIVGVNERGALILENGGELCLEGVLAPSLGGDEGGSAHWRTAWQEIVGAARFEHHSKPAPRRDRYGCLLGGADAAGGPSLQHAVLDEGWAVVDPSTIPDDPDAIEALLAIEDRARTAGRGFWGRPGGVPKKPDGLAGSIGTWQLVEGRVRRVYVNDRYIYLNFGPDWRTDFTARLERTLAEDAALDGDSFRDRRLRLRGVLQESRGPLLHISHPKQIEFLP